MVDGLRVGDADRERANTQLLDAVGAGVIDLHEYEERSGQVWRSRTRSELDALLADLGPEPALPVPAPSPARLASRRRRVVAVLSTDRFAAPVGVQDAVDAYAVLGSAVVDLRREDLPDGLQVTVTSVLGDVTVLVPPDAQVHLTGASILGERSVSGMHGGGPEVHVRAIAVLGSVKVSPGDGQMVPARQAGDPAPPRGGAVSASYQATPTGSRAGRLARRVATGIGGLLVPAVIVGGLIVAGPDGVSIFSSQDVTVRDAQSARVSVLFGSVEVVVPDGARVQTSGVTLFGSIDCDDACLPGNTGPVVDVRSIGGFGSVSIKTESEASIGRRKD